MKKSIWILAVAALALFAACNKYDDSAIRSDLDALKTKVEGLEKTLNQTVTDLQALSKKLDNKLTVTSVTESGSSYVIAFSDGTTATISNGKDGVTPVIGIKEVDGMYYWTVNGELVVDAQGKPIPVAGQGPIFRAGQEEGTLEFSVDGGATWQPIAASSVPVEVEETDTEFILIIGESRIVLPKEVAFTLNLTAPASLVIAYGETAMVAYSVSGAASGEVEVDVLNNGQGFEATVIPANDNAGAVAITNKTNDDDAVLKVFVYATNHTGKSDIKAIVFSAQAGEPEPEVVFEAVLDAKVVPAEGGDFTLKVSADEDYTVSVDADWVTVTPTRALYEDSLPVTVAANPTYEQRSAVITVASKVSDKKVTVAILQEAAEEPEPVDAYMANTGLFTLTATGYYNYIKSSQLANKKGTVNYYMVIYPNDDDTEDYYVGAFYTAADDPKFICYLMIDRDEETGELYLLACENDEWENDEGETVIDWQYGNIMYQNNLYYVTPGGSSPYEIAVADPIKDDVITFVSGDPLDIEGFDDPFAINGVDVYGLIDGELSYFYISIPFPATLTKISDLEEAEESSTALKAMKNAKPSRSAFRAHEFAPSYLQLFTR